MTLHGKDYANLAESITKVVMSETEGFKASNMPIEDITVKRKITSRNFYKNPRFYILIGSAIVAGASGSYVDLIPLIQEVGGAFF